MNHQAQQVSLGVCLCPVAGEQQLSLCLVSAVRVVLPSFWGAVSTVTAQSVSLEVGQYSLCFWGLISVTLLLTVPVADSSLSLYSRPME